MAQEVLPSPRELRLEPAERVAVRAAKMCEIVREGTQSGPKVGARFKDATNFDICVKFLTLCEDWRGDATRDSRARLMFHGTAELNVPSIIEKGFLIPDGVNLKSANGSACGKGIYLSAEPEVAFVYSKNAPVFACLVKPGWVSKIQRDGLPGMPSGMFLGSLRYRGDKGRGSDSFSAKIRSSARQGWTDILVVRDSCQVRSPTYASYCYASVVFLCCAFERRSYDSNCTSL